MTCWHALLIHSSVSCRQRETNNVSQSPLVGARVKIYWPDDEEWYPGTLDAFNAVTVSAQHTCWNTHGKSGPSMRLHLVHMCLLKLVLAASFSSK